MYFWGQLRQEEMSHFWSVFAEETRSDCHKATSSELQPHENLPSLFENVAFPKLLELS